VRRKCTVGSTARMLPALLQNDEAHFSSCDFAAALLSPNAESVAYEAFFSGGARYR